LKTKKGRFEQYFPKAIFSQVEKSTRHADICVLSRNALVGKRWVFGDWSMGFADADGAAQILRGFTKLKSGLRLSSLDEAQTLDILKACSNSAVQLSV